MLQMCSRSKQTRCTTESPKQPVLTHIGAFKIFLIYPPVESCYINNLDE